LPQPLSSSSVGTSADDLAELLQGEGFRVVDLQTDTGNFFLDKYLVHNCFILDDVHSEQEAAIGAYNPEVYDRVYEWYTSGPRQRLQPSGSLVIVMTRWSQRDLTAQVLKSAAMRNSEEWRVIEFPAIMPSGESLWPEFWSTKDLEALREELPNSKWMAQYQQSPTSDSGAIVKREWWQWWEEDEPPECEFIIQAWDTAHEIKKMNDFSACTTWGVWYNDEDRGNANIILLNSLKVRLEFPELKKRALQEYKDWSPDTCIIEKKAAGAPLIQEFRAMGIPVSEFSPGKGQDKISRTNGIADIFSSGKVWAPRTRWAEELIDEMAAFPAGEHDDLHDSAVLAMHRYRQGGYVKLPSDEPEPVEWFKSKRDRKYY
jgi:predicted phage terminase large subunit-like protein